MNLIAIESSTNICSVSSFKDSKLCNVIDLADSKQHSKNLPQIIQEIMRDFDDFSEIKAFAVSVGPGSFTSIRIGLSIVKGLSFGLKNNIVPVPTLEAMNYSVNNSKTHYIALSSYKDKCFIQKFRGKKPIEDPFIDNYDNISKINDTVYLYSDNANHDYESISPSSISLGQYAIANYMELVKKHNEDIHPIYLSDNEFVKINSNRSK